MTGPGGGWAARPSATSTRHTATVKAEVSCPENTEVRWLLPLPGGADRGRSGAGEDPRLAGDCRADRPGRELSVAYVTWLIHRGWPRQLRRDVLTV
jgi:hypothetical protein